jgi:hypothetical protein
MCKFFFTLPFYIQVFYRDFKKLGKLIHHNFNQRQYMCIGKDKGRAVPLQAWGGPEVSRKLRFPDFLTTAQDGGKFVSPTHRPHLPPGNTLGTHFR